MVKEHKGENKMLIVDSQIHIWENEKMNPTHRQVPTYTSPC
jgi:hypothetical protein